jgi:uncharacterized repeat protein (TIGR03803 family)
MRILSFNRHALTCAAFALLAGCGGSQPPIGAPGANSLFVRPSAYTSLYSFQAEPDGENPEARVIPFDNMLYGTTSTGGTKCEEKGCGTVFRITTTGSETVLHRFQGPPDGAEPLAELAPVKQELYGTTYGGGARCRKFISGCGTVFAIGTSGTERALYRFNGIPDGSSPEGPLTLVGDTLYGTTTAGGTKCVDYPHGCGTVFSIKASGEERVLYQFKGYPDDGSFPTGNLIYLNGTLYGTTSHGGPFYGGVVFAITPSGKERVLYGSGSSGHYDMVAPSGLVAMGGVLYGSSIEGGAHAGGTVYAVTTSGEERIVYNFSQEKERNGNRPFGRLIAVDGLLYGTTLYGGQNLTGYGVVFALNTSGEIQVLYRFKGPPDGSYPNAGLVDGKGALYGHHRPRRDRMLSLWLQGRLWNGVPPKPMSAAPLPLCTASRSRARVCLAGFAALRA